MLIKLELYHSCYKSHSNGHLDMLFLPKTYEYLKPFLNIELYMKEYADEEGLLIVMKASELAGDIAALTWNWNNHPEPVKVAYEHMDKVHKLFLEIPEYEQTMGSKLNEYHRNKINNAIVDLRKLLPYMKNKIKPYEGLEKLVD